MPTDDVLADRRFQFAEMLRSRGDLDAAVDLYREAIEIAPDWPEAHFALGDTLSELGDNQTACQHFADYLRLAKTDVMGAELRLALLGAAPVPDTFPEAYVRQLFDQYAPRFEESLLTKLNYSAPAQLRAAVDSILPPEWIAEVAVDLGCGTGLAGEIFRDKCARLDGVDLSGKMLRVAERKQLYDHLGEGDIMIAFADAIDTFDLILAADVLIYIGDLTPLFEAVAKSLRPGGVFAFTVEHIENEDFVLREKCRYAHSADYLARLAAAAGLDVRVSERTSCRSENRVPVDHLLCVMQKPSLTLWDNPAKTNVEGDDLPPAFMTGPLE